MTSLRLIRADGGPRIGAGHVMRCLSLAQAWRRGGGDALFALAESTPGLERRLNSETLNFIRLSALPGSADDAEQTIALAIQRGASWIVADGYRFDAEFQHRVKAAGMRLLLVDDYGHAEHYCADFVLNQNLDADAALYVHREPYTRLLLGCRYALLRQQFLSWLNWSRPISAVARRVLITLGGSDPDNATGKVVKALQQVKMDSLEVVIVVGGGNPHFEALQSASRNLPCAVQLIRDASNMPELMASADVAIAAGGSTSWELAFMGLPSLTLVLADNQAPIADSLQQRGVAVNLGWAEQIPEDRIAMAIDTLLCDTAGRREMSENGRRLVDGLGSDRVAKAMTEALL